MFKRLLIAALAALLPLTVSASHTVGNNGAEANSDYYSYWKTADDEIWRNRYDECWVTIKDESYQNTLGEALFCGDAVEVESVVFVEYDVHFPTDVHVIDQDQLNNLRTFITDMRSKNINVDTAIVSGHTDSTHTDEYNMALGDRRAKALVVALESQGIKVLSATSFGESDPVDTNDTVAGRAENRRSESTLGATVHYIIRK